jgi:hypothetical protein
MHVTQLSALGRLLLSVVFVSLPPASVQFEEDEKNGGAGEADSWVATAVSCEDFKYNEFDDHTFEHENLLAFYLDEDKEAVELAVGKDPWRVDRETLQPKVWLYVKERISGARREAPLLQMNSDEDNDSDWWDVFCNKLKAAHGKEPREIPMLPELSPPSNGWMHHNKPMLSEQGRVIEPVDYTQPVSLAISNSAVPPAHNRLGNKTPWS